MIKKKQSSIQFYANASHNLINKYLKGDISVGNFVIQHNNLFHEANRRFKIDLEDAQMEAIETYEKEGGFHCETYWNRTFDHNQ